MESNFAKRLKKESLEKRLAVLEENYQALERDYKEAGDADEKNRLQSKLDRKLEEIEKIDQELNQLIKCSIIVELVELVDILNNYFGEQRNDILRAYNLSLPNRLIDKEKIPQNATELINGLQLPQQQDTYSYIDKFVGYLFLLLKQTVSVELKPRLKAWAEENINNCEQLLEQLREELKKREQQCYPVLLVAISERKGSYVVEAWLNKNIAQYNLYASSDCEQLTINQQSEIATDETLNNVPELLKNLIAQSFDKCQKYLKQIHIFLPSKFMNYAVDWWQNWQENEEQEDNYTPTIGEDYEVLLRCSERLRGKSPPVFKWREKGYILKSKLTQPAKQIFVLRDSNNWKTLLRQLKQDEPAIAVTITTVFQQKQPGTILWQSAVPLALWIRQQLPQIENKSVLDELLKDCCLKEVPNQVKLKRVEAIDCEPPENHVGRHLCLLWDDPNLLPPEQLLTEINL